uniref:RanBD1 domain-containing protein n=1 Tax=Leersia perrieri TaxID=77586 RepID=A0A0D9VX77_9ORYZ
MTTRGAKRAATSDPTASELPSKRVMDGPSFDVHRAESSHQHMMAGPATLDPQRAEAASKHVRALNTQFASWVQSQLQNHPAELWEDGMKDYISHASEIMEKFKDVVNWLRQNKTGSAVVSSPSPPNDEKKTASPAAVDNKFMMAQPSSDNGQKSPVTAASSPLFQNSSSPNLFSFSSQQKTPAFIGIFGDKKNLPGDSNKPTFQFGANNGFTTPSTPSIFSASATQNFSMPTQTMFSVNQQPFISGNKNTTEASGDADEDAEPEQPSSPSVKKAEEKGIVVVHEAKCKVYVKHDDASKGWKDIGVGQLKIRCKEGAEKASKESTPTIVIRNDVGKILLNALIYKGIKMNIQKNTVASIFHTSDGQSSESGSDTVVARTYLFRLKNEDEATKLSAAIKENAPSE